MSQDGKVKFIRIRGRIVPIREKKAQKERQKASRVGAAVGGAVGAKASLVSPIREDMAIRKAQVMKSPSAFRKRIKAGDILLFESKGIGQIEALVPTLTTGSRYIHASVATSKEREAVMDLEGGKVRKLSSKSTKAYYASEVLILRPKNPATARRGALRASKFVKGRKYDDLRGVMAGFLSKFKKPGCKEGICYDVPSRAYIEDFGGYKSPREMLKSNKFEAVARLRRTETSWASKITRYGVRPALGAAAFGTVGAGIGWATAKVRQLRRGERNDR